MINRKLRMGMIGGGPGAFIGGVHRIAAWMDGEIELVCGAFSSNAEKSKSMAAIIHLPSNRIYGNYEEMILKEKQLPEDQRMDFVSIVTPNNVHFAPAKLALENGFHVVLDKPMTFTLEEAKELKNIIEKSGKYFCLTHTYTGYPMVKEARYQVQEGRLGKIKKIVAAYPQGWLTKSLEKTDYKQAQWRTDPSRSGIAGAMGDIGTHAFNLAEYVSGLQVTKLCADISTMVEGRHLDDDGQVFVKFNNGAGGLIYASQIMAGEENDVSIKVYGDEAGLEWKQSDNNSLLLKWLDRPTEILRAGGNIPYLSSFAKHNI
ncbi:MAG TPA: Gfo/Idh/MocA family oxidoreductase, partial [Flavisolibacter sp.]|nr:Gfo/Idh/MocA family oxidoreductase [Flavisolibacter sp.]